MPGIRACQRNIHPARHWKRSGAREMDVEWLNSNSVPRVHLICHWPLLSMKALTQDSVTACTEQTSNSHVAFFLRTKRNIISIYYVFENVSCYTVNWLRYFIAHCIEFSLPSYTLSIHNIYVQTNIYIYIQTSIYIYNEIRLIYLEEVEVEIVLNVLAL